MKSMGGAILKVMPFLLAIFGWSYLPLVPIVKDYTPSVVGFDPFGVLTFLGVYLVARLCRVTGVGERCRCRWLVCAAVLSGAMCWIGFKHYNSPFALIFAGSLFFLIKRIKLLSSILHLITPLTPPLKTLVLFISPSMFSVYLLHTNNVGFALRRAECWMMEQGWNYYAMAFVVAGAIYVGSVLLDMPRRLKGVLAVEIGRIGRLRFNQKF